MGLARKLGLPYLALEDGFLRSVGVGAAEPPLSMVLDDVGVYYDASAPSRLEGLIGRAEVDPKRMAKARKQIAQAAAGIRARDYTARPDYLSCTYCAFRDICPASAAT